MKTKLEQALESGTIQFPRGLTGEERREFIKEKLVDSVEETRRKLFESKYQPDDGVEWNPHNSKYEAFTFFDRSRQHSCDWQNNMFEVFNAALDAVEIELPALKNSSSYYDGGDVHDSAINQCRYKIEALNLGIKIK